LNCVILQPSYFPWRGYFHQIQKADVFVFYDDVQYDRRGWRNRNRIATDRGPAWLTVPVNAHGSHSGLQTLDIGIAWDAEPHWNVNHMKRLRQAYLRAPYFSTYEAMLEGALATIDHQLVDLLIRTTKTLAAALGISKTRFLRSSELNITGGATERLVEISRSVGADRYITGPSAASYLDESQFASAGIELEYMRYEYPAYEQLYEPYDGHLSLIDLLMMKGPDAPHYIWPG
jgi:hypothetical protein